MDIATLIAFLSPCLPFLMKLGGKAAESASGKLGTDTWEAAKKIWDKLSPNVEAKGDAKIAAKQLAEDPESKGRKVLFQEELEKLFKEHPNLEEAIAQIINDAPPKVFAGVQITQTATGDKNVIIGQMSGGTFHSNVP